MNKIGVHALTFIGDIENHSIESCLSRVAKIGYDVMELPLLNPDALDTNFVSKTYEKFNELPSKNPVLISGDIVNVKMSALGYSTAVISKVTSPIVGLYTLFNVLEDL